MYNPTKLKKTCSKHVKPVTSCAKYATCKYCGGSCEFNERHACDGYLSDIDNLYKDAEKKKETNG